MEWNIGNVTIKNQIVLAPMAGTSNPAYMQICAEMGVGYAITELISVEAIVRNNKKTFEMLKGIEDLNIPVAVQIFGSNPKTMAEAAKILCNLYNIKIIDINMGCPVPKVAIRSEAGSALLKNPSKIGEILKEVVNAVSVPVTVKIRSGWDKSHINAVEVAKICEQNGAKAIAIHARTKEQGYSGKANWDIIKAVKESVSIPIIGNGDIVDAISAKKMLDYTKCDAIMIGRASLGNPWIFNECLTFLTKNILLPKPTYAEKLSMIKKHFELLKRTKNPKLALLEIRTHALYYLKGMPESKTYKELICKCKSETEFLNVLKEYEQNFKS